MRAPAAAGPGTDVTPHVSGAGGPEVDHLRTDAADRERYARAERALAHRVWRHVQDSADAKTAVVEEIVRRAQRR